MNRFIRLINIFLVTLVLSFMGVAHALEPAQLEPRPIERFEIGTVGHICDNANTIILDWRNPNAVVEELIPVLENYDNQTPSLLYEKAGQYAYCIKFEVVPADKYLSVSQQIIFNNKDDHDVYIMGLKLKSNLQESPLIVFHRGGEGKIILKNIELIDAEDGLTLMAKVLPGRAFPEEALQVINSQVTGANKEGNCFIVKGKGTVLDNVTATNCAEGIRVEAQNVRIENSHIFDNKVGVHATVATTIRSSKIYANDDPDTEIERRFDGLRLDPGIMRDLRFLDVVDGEVVERGAQEDVIVYEERPVYILLPEVQNRDSGAELFMTEKDDCDVAMLPFEQACGFVEAWPEAIPIDDLRNNGMVMYSLREDYFNKHLVVIFTSPDLGSTVISQRFMTGGPIAFVGTPYDIPTPGGDVGDQAEIAAGGPPDDDDVDETGGEGMGGDGVFIDSTELGGGVGLTPTAKCSLMPGETLRTVCVGFELWWLIFAIALIGALRTICVRITNRRR